MKNPLRRRILRELRSEFGKYLVIFLLMMSSIGFVSGFLVADNSMITAYQNSFEKYNIEDGNFRTAESMTPAQRKAAEKLGIRVYDNFYSDQTSTGGTTLRIFADRSEVNRVCLMSGRMPAAPGEIALDRLYARNNQIQIGDIIFTGRTAAGGENADEAGGRAGTGTWMVVGIAALPDYSCLFQNNSDSMFDSVRFGVGIVTDAAFRTFDENDISPVYSWKYDAPPSDESEEKTAAEDLMKALNREVKLKSFIPRYLNRAIQFTGEDMGSDKAMMIILLYIIISIMAFVFGITITSTIQRESPVIGTLRASGYTRAELIRHYMTAPLLVSFLGAVIGNILGYTLFRVICAWMYYNSYSLTTYTVLWNADALFITTVIPMAMMFLINFFFLARALSLSPLKFLRRDLSRRKQKRAFPLPGGIPFFSRFRIRVFLQNISNYILLFVGILFANLLLLFGLGLPDVLHNYEESVTEQMLCKYQYFLTLPMDTVDEDHKLESMLAVLRFYSDVETENDTAEKISIHSLQTSYEQYRPEEILLYGIEDHSRYVPLDLSGSQVYISSAYADKYNLEPGDVISLKEKYEDQTYDFIIDGIYPNESGLTVFMNRAFHNRVFGEEEDFFSGYFADTPITDIDEKYIDSVLDLEALTKISRQLDVSMGGMMSLVDGFAIGIFMILMYLLSKLIIEKNAVSISLAKILGYSTGEIARLYIVSTSIMTVFCLIATQPLVYAGVTRLLHLMMLTEMTGWIPMNLSPGIFARMFFMGIAAYLVVAVLEFRRICRIPMDTVLKQSE